MGNRHRSECLLTHNTICNTNMNTRCSRDTGGRFVLSLWEVGKPCERADAYAGLYWGLTGGEG